MKYFYRAINKIGQEITGNKEASDEYDLAKYLRLDGLSLIFAQAEKDSAKKSLGSININLPFLNDVKFVDRLMLVRNLQVMVAAGVSLPQSLDILTNQSESPQLKKVLLNIKEEILKGKSLSEAAAKHPKVFSDFFCGMVSIGEKTGNLDKVLKELAYQMEKEYKLTSKIKGAMMYPSIILSALFIIGMGMLMFVVPTMTKVFVDMGVELPPTTKFVIAIGDYFSNRANVVLFIGIFIFLIAGLKIFFGTKVGRDLWDRYIIEVPIIGPLLKKGIIGGIIGNFGILLSSGVSVTQSLAILASTTGNIHYRRSLEEASQKIQKGEKMSVALASYSKLYPSSVVQMINIGEETGMTSEILRKLSDFYEEEVSRAAESLTTAIEPVLMLVVAIAVGFFAISMFAPIYSSMGNF